LRIEQVSGNGGRVPEQAGVKAPFTFQALSFPNHCDNWVLRNLPERSKLRAWVKSVLKEYPDLAE
jgi:hypothetical protein